MPFCLVAILFTNKYNHKCSKRQAFFTFFTKKLYFVTKDIFAGVAFLSLYRKIKRDFNGFST